MTLFMTEIHVADPDRAARWYSRTLGLRVTHRDDLKGFVLVEATGGGRIALTRGEPIRGCRLVFRVDDVGAERDRLRVLGVEVTEVAHNAEEHYREVRLSDPDGTPITLFAWANR
ncbi:VOC family protein [Tautonia plasticadhaerens]|uniref:Glyoxalase-like domain protein n=1 Tax=Tautonia plasticadhaerens TaxID=2527974 RepID=A0A518GXY2_9BACT|nr:VOC family protein [Tautonia plasticadhaerens]QDV33402.1 Glyoxalase-like domain protein [Tautonia plasticadhaerens]